MWTRFALAALAGGALFSTSGCFVAADALNPAIAGLLGIDDNNAQGSIIVQFNNQTQFVASMAVGVGLTASAPEVFTDGHRGVTTISPGEQANIVLDCPIASLRPTGMAAGELEGEEGPAAASVFGVMEDDAGGDGGGDGEEPPAEEPDAEEQTVDVVFSGGTLRSDFDFQCGDVIEVRLIEVATTGTDADRFRVIVRRVPGR